MDSYSYWIFAHSILLLRVFRISSSKSQRRSELSHSARRQIGPPDLLINGYRRGDQVISDHPLLNGMRPHRGVFSSFRTGVNKG